MCVCVRVGQLCEKDAQIEEILRQKLQIFSDLAEAPMESSTTVRRLLLRGSASELLQGELFINNAIIQGIQTTRMCAHTQNKIKSV